MALGLTFAPGLGIAAQDASAAPADTAAIIQNADPDSIEAMLAQTAPGSSGDLERLILEKAKSMVLSGDYPGAARLAEIVLLHNLDNLEAQDLFTAIEDAKREQAALEEKKRRQAAEAEAKRQAEAQAQAEREAREAQAKAEREAREAKERADREELERVRQAAAEKARQEQEEAARKQAAEEAYLKSIREVGLDNFSLALAISPAAFAVEGSDFVNAYTGKPATLGRYGFRAAVEGGFRHPYLFVRVRGWLDLLPVQFLTEESFTGISAVATIGTELPGIPLGVSGGYGYSLAARPAATGTPSRLFTEMGSPFIGLGLDRWRLTPDFDITLHAFMPFVFITDPLIDFALAGFAETRWRFARLDPSWSLYAAIAAQPAFLFAGSKAEGSIRLNASIGVAVND